MYLFKIFISAFSPNVTYLYSSTQCQYSSVRVRTEIGNQNSRTFPGLFKDYLHFFQESFS